MFRVLLVFMILSASSFGEVTMSAEQLRSFVQSSKRLGHPDKQVAEYLKNVKVTEKLTPGAVEDMQAAGAGPKTVEVLKRLVEASKSLPAPAAPAAPAVQQQAAVIPPPSSEEEARVLQEVREYAMDYSKRLPNFIC